jgi:hypothetical protein
MYEYIVGKLRTKHWIQKEENMFSVRRMKAAGLAVLKALDHIKK